MAVVRHDLVNNPAGATFTFPQESRVLSVYNPSTTAVTLQTGAAGRASSIGAGEVLLMEYLANNGEVWQQTSVGATTVVITYDDNPNGEAPQQIVIAAFEGGAVTEMTTAFNNTTTVGIINGITTSNGTAVLNTGVSGSVAVSSIAGDVEVVNGSSELNVGGVTLTGDVNIGTEELLEAAAISKSRGFN